MRTSHAALLATLLIGCSAPADDSRTSPADDAFRVGGLPAQDGPSGLRDDAPAPVRRARGSDGGNVDRLALLAIDDVEEFWRDTHRTAFGTDFRPVGQLLSYDSEDPNAPALCGHDLYRAPNAMFCPADDTIAWDRGFLVPTGQQFFGDASIAALMAHEYGHAVEHDVGLANLFTETIVMEQQADCLAGAYTRWVAQGDSPRFTLSTGDGLNHVLAAVITLRDHVLEPDEAELIEEGHGTALDRVSAFQMGFESGVETCKAIDLDEIEQRRGDLPLVLQTDWLGNTQSGEMPVDQNTLAALMELLDQVYTPASPPGLSMTPEQCPGTASSPPASYCPATNMVSVDLPLLQQMSKPADEEQHVLPQGDNTALSIVTSRYALSLLNARGEPLDSPTAALRTACLTGVAQQAMAQPIDLPSGQSLLLAAGDMDEAVGGLLTNGLVAGTVDGSTVPAGFTRIEAFRGGLSSTDEQCFDRY